MSISAIFDPTSAGRCSTSPTMFFMNTVEPAPMKAILGNDIATQPSRLPLLPLLREKVAAQPTDEGRRNSHRLTPPLSREERERGTGLSRKSGREGERRQASSPMA